MAGVALVIVLGMLVLVAVLVVAFLTSVSTELQSAKSYASGSDARSLADSAVNIVISQVQDATSTPSLAWASQPGMIRTYDNTGNAAAAYKLYSAPQLQLNGATMRTYNPATNLSAEIPDDWATHPSLYTDLNQPVTVSGVDHYPIIHPGAFAASKTDPTALSGAGTPIEGCYLNTSTPIVAITPVQMNPLPMPVAWLYALKDGSIASMDPVTKKVAGAGARLADGTPNEIVGRVAFWTDDESCKVNVNTASEGSFWDRPWTSSSTTGYENTLSQHIPAQNEFQRYPGHPAMTSLSVIFPMQPDEAVAQYNARIYGIVPRVVDGGSKSGTVTVNYKTPPVVADTDRLFASVDEFLFKGTAPVSGMRPVNPSGSSTSFTEDDIERARCVLTTSSRSPEVNLFNKPRVTLWPLQANTAHVSDPANASDRNAQDKLIAFCSTVGTRPYYFQRYNTFDYTIGGPNDRGTGAYNPSQSPMPSSQSPIMDWSLIPRNQDLYAYLQSVTSAPIPGLGGALGGASGKYNAATRDQILTEMFDYLRSNINITNPGIPTAGKTTGYSYAPFAAKVSSNAWTGQFQVVPLSLPNNTKGFGLFPTVTQAAIIFYKVDNVLVDNIEQQTAQGTYTGQTHTVAEGPTPRMGAFLVLQPFTPTPGPPAWSANVRYVVKGLDRFSVNGGSMGFPAQAVNLVTARDGQCNATALTGFELGTEYWPLSIKRPGQPVVGANDEEEFYPFVSAPIPFSPASPAFNFSGGDITIEIYSGYAKGSIDPTGAGPVQTVHMTFPPASGLPVPQPAYSQSYNATTGVTTVTQYNDIRNRFGALESGGPGIQQNGQHNPMPLIVRKNGATATGDTVRSVEVRAAKPPGNPSGGDYRLIAGLQNVPSTYFEGHGMVDTPADGMRYSDTSAASRQIHSLRVDADSGSSPTANGVNGFYVGSGAPHGKLLAAAAYYTGAGKKGNREPAVPRGLVEATMQNGSLGDWDTGIGRQRDGPYINKADLGNVGSNATVTNGYYNALGLDRSAADGVLTDIGASFSPNRQIASAVSFGSLPTGIDPSSPNNARPWQTLLFCKDPLAGATHPGFGISSGSNGGPPYTTAPDHAFLDLFTMPIVEPYAISEPFSTAGKVNMNYQMVPFTYLTRDSAVRAVLKATNIMAIPTSIAPIYKENQASNPTTPDCRYTINPDEQNGTLRGFEQRFGSGDIFRSASEICDIYLVPKQKTDGTDAPGAPTYDSMDRWWRDYQLTGDNVREVPYGQIYPRLTTKSNTFTVHVKTQLLKKSRQTAVDEFVDGQDQITGEYRGSFVIERYLDPGADSLVKADGKTPADERDPDAMVGPYKIRILSSKRFAP